MRGHVKPWDGRTGRAWTAVSYAGNWADIGGGWAAGRWRLIDGLWLEVEGFALRSGSTAAANAIICTLPGAPAPSALKMISYIASAGGVVAANQVYMNTSGEILTGVAIAAGTAVPIFGRVAID